MNIIANGNTEREEWELTDQELDDLEQQIQQTQAEEMTRNAMDVRYMEWAYEMGFDPYPQDEDA